ncbi:hypothetical protein KHQ82_00035 [Mycoplasmatota bacterium]|nr:hypothetical protein KHQ82_00035 [Mycoplasmatota bacterium]
MTKSKIILEKYDKMISTNKYFLVLALGIVSFINTNLIVKIPSTNVITIYLFVIIMILLTTLISIPNRIIPNFIKKDSILISAELGDTVPDYEKKYIVERIENYEMKRIMSLLAYWILGFMFVVFFVLLIYGILKGIRICD